jgi:uncharacterized membrane protein
MHRSCKELKRIARENLADKYAIPMRAYIYATLIAMLVEFPFTMMQTQDSLSTQNIIIYVAQLIISVATIVLTCGEYRIHLMLAKGQKAELTDLFYPLRHQPDRYILGRLLYLGLALVGMLPMIGAGILMYTENTNFLFLALALTLLSCILVLYVALNLDLVFFFMLDDENLTLVEAFRKCQQTMKGHKRRYLYMSLSFIGMLLLVALSLGIATLWVRPYINQSVTLLYLDVTGQLDSIEAAKKNPQPQEAPVLNPYI